jgi:hypothetical protein
MIALSPERIVALWDLTAAEYRNTHCERCGQFVWWDALGEHECFRVAARVRLIEALITPAYL